MNVEIKLMNEMRTACLRHVGPYNRIGEAFERLGTIAGRAGLLRARPTMLAIYHDDPETTPEAQRQSDAAVVVPDDVTVPEGLTERRLAAGRYARTIHKGSYETLGDTWARLMGQWLPHSGERVGSGASFEIYRNTPGDTAKEDLITELYVSLA